MDCPIHKGALCGVVCVCGVVWHLRNQTKKPPRKQTKQNPKKRKNKEVGKGEWAKRAWHESMAQIFF